MVVNKMVQKLLDIGFSENEAKAYIALVGTHPATAYEIAKKSSIPTSKIYEVVARLQDKGVVSVTEDDRKKRYIPIAPDEFIEKSRSKLDRTLTSLKRDLSKVHQEDNVSYIWNIHEYEYLLEKAARMIKESRNYILLSGWEEELTVLEHVLKKKKLPISTVHFGRGTMSVGQVFPHPIEDTLYAEKGGRGLVVIADGKEALMGTVFPHDRVEGAWSKNNGFVTLAEDYVKHDIYIMKIVKRFDALLKKRFGENYKKLRDIFQDNEEEI